VGRVQGPSDVASPTEMPSPTIVVMRGDTVRTRPSWGGAALLVAVLTAATAVVPAGPAGAHGDDGIMEVLVAEADAMEITVEVGIVYADDDHLAIDATVEATATGPAGAVVGPVEMPNRRDAIYGATFEVPTAGDWSVEVTSENPDATAVEQVTVTAPTTTRPPPTSAPDGDETVADVDDDPAVTTTVGATTIDEEPEDDETVAADVIDADDSEDGIPAWLIGAVVVVALAAIAAVLALGARSRAPGSTDAPEPVGDENPPI
jgi:hypothetical protein